MEGAHVTEEPDQDGSRTSDTENVREEQLAQPSKDDFKSIFLKTDETSNYLENGQFEEAYGILYKKSKLTEELRHANFLLKYCECLLVTENDYERPKCELKAAMARLNPLRETVLWLAKKLFKANRPFGSIILYEIFYEMFFMESDLNVKVEILEDCVSGLKRAITSMTEDNESFDIFVCRHLLQRMYDMRSTLLEMENVNPKYKCVKYAWLTHHVEGCESNSHKCIEIIMETIRYMKEKLGSNALRHQIYGTLCHNVATNYLKLGFDEQAILNYKEALKSFKLATDFQVENHRQMHIMKTGIALRRAEGTDEVVGVEFVAAPPDRVLRNLVRRENGRHQPCISS